MKNKDEEIIQTIINAGQKLFLQYGLNKTTMEDIAKAAHKGKSTLYYYFPSKESIFEEVVNREINTYFDLSQQASKDATNSVDKLKINIKKKVEQLTKQNSFYNLLRNTEYASDFFNKYRLKYDEIEVDILHTIFVEGLQKKELNIDENIDLRLMSELFVSALRGVETDIIMRNKFNDLDKQIDFFIELMLKSFR